MTRPDMQRPVHNTILIILVMTILLWLMALTYSMIRINNQAHEICEMAESLDVYYRANEETFRRRNSPTDEALIRNTQGIIHSIDNLNC